MISLSLACIDYLHVEQQILELERANVDLYHIDIMDGHFVPNLCLNYDLIEQIRTISRTPMDVHLMVNNPLEHITRLTDLKIEYACCHISACKNPGEFLSALRANGTKCGFALSPDDNINVLLPYLTRLDYVLLLFVTPGFAGQNFNPAVLTKLAKLNQIRKEQNLRFLIMADGGVGWDNVTEVAAAGADIIVAGKFTVFSDENTLYADSVRLKNMTQPAISIEQTRKES